MGIIDTVDALEQIIGKTPKMMMLKTIDHLDPGALQWISASPLMFASFSDGTHVRPTIGGGDAGWAKADKHEIRFSTDMLDDVSAARVGAGFGSIFLIPSIREVMRINGTVVEADVEEIAIRVNECFFHCGKALVRSKFWQAERSDNVPDDMQAIIAKSQFMVLATVNADGHVDVSPKGDMPGKMALLEEGKLWFPDRPGNKRVDSFRNILTQPNISGLLLEPGSATVVRLIGSARLTTDPDIRERFRVYDKTPQLATVVEDLTIDIGTSKTLMRIQIWPAAAAPKHIRPSKIGLGHMKLSKNMAARLAGAAMPAGILEKGLEQDYKDNLF